MPKKKRATKKEPVKRKAVRRKPVRKKPAKRPVRKTTHKPKPKAARQALPKKAKENVIGIVTHYFPKVRAAVVKLKAPLAVGDTVKIKGHTTDFTQDITSLQIDRVPITQAKKGQEIGLLVNSRVRQHDIVCKV
jgi:putative protease